MIVEKCRSVTSIVDYNNNQCISISLQCLHKRYILGLKYVVLNPTSDKLGIAQWPVYPSKRMEVFCL